jgi:tRNA threonylcarbamoyladenosine biosynthesis protein TsaB
MILAIDASTTGCSVAVFNEDKVQVSISSRKDRSAAENLTTMIEQALSLAGTDRKSLRAVAVAKGPGSYTGLRIAVSTAKGLAYALGIPLISFGTLEGLVQAVQYTGGYDFICPMIDARRMEVFCAVFDAKTRTSVRETEALLIDEFSFAEFLDRGKVLFLGEGSEKCKGVIQHPNAYFLDKVLYPEVHTAALLVDRKWQAGDFEDLVSFEPFYLKEYMFKN